MRQRAEEMARFLSELIRVDTTNPPGNETEAAKLVAEKLRDLGFSPVVVESEPSRGNVIARAEKGEPGPTVLLLSHLDVVPAKREKWKVDPFSGEIRDGFVWGGELSTVRDRSLWSYTHSPRLHEASPSRVPWCSQLQRTRRWAGRKAQGG